MGHFIASKDAKKVYQIDDLVAMTTAGSVGDARDLLMDAGRVKNSIKCEGRIHDC